MVHRGEDGPDHGACDRHLGKLESDGAGVAHDACPDLISLSCRLVSDQSVISSGSSMQRRKVAKL